jgi:hypothetical protein
MFELSSERRATTASDDHRSPAPRRSGRLGPSRTIRVEPIRGASVESVPLSNLAPTPAPSHLAGGGGPSSEPSGPGLFRVPDLIEPVVAFRTFRAMGARLRSPYRKVFWDDRVLSAVCECSHGSSHRAPSPGCNCGIYATFRPQYDFARIDYRGVVGIVSVWGRIEVHRDGMRAEHARVEALSVYGRWHRRQKRAVSTIAKELGVELVALEELEWVAGRYGHRLAPSLHYDGETSRRLSARRSRQLASAAS